jgi:hypothetical protein
MTAPGNSPILILMALLFVIASAYASGRLHQWYRHGVQRDRAYRKGYDEASHTLFDLAIQKNAPKAGKAAIPIPIGRSQSGVAAPGRIFRGAERKSSGRHSAA